MSKIYWIAHTEQGKLSLKEIIDKVSRRDDLVHQIVNAKINDFVGALADYDEDEKPQDPTIANGIGSGKRVPYIGWYWRSVDWCSKQVPIGDCGEFIGFMENNKWDYPERLLTPKEFDEVMKIVIKAIGYGEEGGSVKEIEENKRRELEKLWPLMQTFEV